MVLFERTNVPGTESTSNDVNRGPTLLAVDVGICRLGTPVSFSATVVVSSVLCSDECRSTSSASRGRLSSAGECMLVISVKNGWGL